jgi:predicted NBD/HSP70 family sugar kinase
VTPPVVVGVDVGGTKISAAVATTDGAILRESTTATDPVGGLAVVEQVRRQVDELCQPLGFSAADAVSIGVGIAGVLDPGGLVTDAPNVGLDGHALKLALDDRLSHDVIVDNDVNAAALGEHRHGHGRSVTNLAFIAVGTGIGLGLIVGGSVVRGSRGAAGEIGHLPFGADLLDQRNHRRGPLEESASGAAIAARYREKAGTSLSVPEIFELAVAKDAAASAVLDDEAGLLAQAIVAIVAVVDPAMVVLGGGVGSQPLLVDLVRPWLQRFGHSTVDVRLSKLGPRATMIGAIELARDGGRVPRAPEPLP